MTIRPTSSLVAVHWLKAITRLGGRVARKLPADTSTSSCSEFPEKRFIQDKRSSNSTATTRERATNN